VSHYRVLAMVCASSVGACAGGGGEGHDVVPPSYDVQVRGDEAKSAASQGYDYVARRPLAVVALAEARGLDAATAHAAVDRLADALDTCATDQGRQGKLVDGAARIAVQIDELGNIAGSTVKIDPGPGVAENAALCFVAPVKRLTFPPADASGRGFAVEAIWGRVIPGK
jgi:hypothetical protein